MQNRKTTRMSDREWNLGMLQGTLGLTVSCVCFYVGEVLFRGVGWLTW